MLIDLNISKDLWNFINNNNLPFKLWPEDFRREFAELKLDYAAKNIILSRNSTKAVWRLDTAKAFDNTKNYRFKNTLINPIFSDKYVINVADKGERKTPLSSEEMDIMFNKLLEYIKSLPNGITYMEMSKYVVEKLEGREWTRSQRDNSAITRFMKRLADARVVKNFSDGKYYFNK